MPSGLVLFITKYGYAAIFALVFLQEIGIPEPVPNEFVLLFAGYLAYAKVLRLTLVLLTVIGADFLGTSLLFAFFYHFGNRITGRSMKWFHISREKIESLHDRISRHGRWGIYAGRLIPYLRGYTSVAAGLIKIRPRSFLSTVFISAVTWSGSYSLIGNFMGRYWQGFAIELGRYESLLLCVCATLIVALGTVHLIHRRQKKLRCE
ncbi:MAG: DedA family protein [Bacteroidetes bacterium]|nr:DedA family protein [Bacteroidota bacterium]